MAPLTSNYAGWTGAQLWQQIRVRQSFDSGLFEGIHDQSPSDKMVNALITDDERRVNARPELPDGTSMLPDLKRSESVYVPSPGIPTREMFRHGHARRDFGHIPVPDKKDPKKTTLPKVANGEHFAVCRHEPDTYGKTVTCMNQIHTWQGTEAEFRQFFTAVELAGHTVGKNDEPPAVDTSNGRKNKNQKSQSDETADA